MMKKNVCMLFILALLFLAGSACAGSDFTLLIYMCGSDIQSNACEDIYEMGLAENSANVNIVILAGGASEWDFDDIEGNTRNLITIQDGAFTSITDWGWASMGSEESLLEFLEYGFTEFPADRTAVILWDHGSGSEAGVCFDDTTQDQDALTLVEINNVLYDLSEKVDGAHIDLFGCDACMMATYEMAAMLSCYNIDYYLASEELEPGSGWHYTPWIQALDNHPDMPTAQLCQLIADTYAEAALHASPDEYVTLSAVDLRQMPPLLEAMESLGMSLSHELENGNTADIRRRRSRMYAFGSFVDASWDMVDLGAVLDAYAHIDPDSAASARSALRSAVVYSLHTDNLGSCCGLSVLIPQDTKNEFESLSDGMDLSFYMPEWLGFVKAYAGQISSGSYNFGQTTPENVSGSGFLSEISGLFEGLSDEYCWNDAEQAYENLPQTATDFTALEGEYAFSASISATDLQYLDYVEGMMMLSLSDEDMLGYVDLGLMQNNVIDWSGGTIYSLFDGTWPVLAGQLVPMYDQISNEYGRRSLIPVKLNGEYTYLVVEFQAGSTEGRILGANAGYDENGLPIRNTTRLNPGDSLIPVYTMYYAEDEEDELEEMEFDGDEIIWQPGMTVVYEDIRDESDPQEMLFCFVLNDVFGGYDMTEIIPFEL